MSLSCSQLVAGGNVDTRGKSRYLYQNQISDIRTRISGSRQGRAGRELGARSQKHAVRGPWVCAVGMRGYRLYAYVLYAYMYMTYDVALNLLSLVFGTGT
jgi:hypothetical protein